MPIDRPPLPPADYQRIFRVVKSVFDGAAASTADASLFFSVAGAYLVQQVYKKRCQPVAGAAFYKLDDEAQSVLAFHDSAERDNLSSKQGFHCWVMCEGYIIDFMAPLFRESLEAIGSPAACSRKMFQKRLSAMADSRLQMRNPGDFFMLPNVDLTRELLTEFYAKDEANDLLEVCMHWYRKPPAKIEPQLSVQRSDGSISDMALNGMSLSGVW